ncbi:ATP-dependent DNA helicase RecG [Pelotomaculum sp. FP]|uniref:ATP-dependent DNA helicase RecG n=1 Tax=Pelotomaculum sp. FP TaxID=261474 RepID=UPI0010646958|nr:ATP-dependent DNA helicase RecG [Pelotomaculum sp. FP]TEB14121.1 ATP-dependent DNA helicase RecG [Pelotomaculum sp. FP]
MPADFFAKPVQYLKMIGPRRAAAMQKLGLFTVRDLLYHFPRRYEDRSRLLPAGACPHGETATIRGTVLAAQDLKPRRGLTVTKLAVHDGTGIFYAVWFNQPFVKKSLSTGTKLFVTGKVDKSFGPVQVMVEDYEVAEGGDPLGAGRLVPIYPLTGQLTQRLLRAVVKTTLDEARSNAGEFLPAELLGKYKLPVFGDALASIHFPECREDLEKARRRFIFEELFLLQLGLAVRRATVAARHKEYRCRRDGGLTSSFIHNLPYRLTGDQVRVWGEIAADMESSSPMQRLLQGDVGSGKTVISILALLKAVENGLQGALMAPTEILAEQHYLVMKRTLVPIGVEAGLLTSSTPKKEKELLLQRLAEGDLKLLVGTHALIQQDISFQRLGLVVVDEQHRFGVRQRAALQYKGSCPDTLVMTATPIPRTLALTLYGDLDLSVISETPPGRLPVKTYAVLPSALHKAYKLAADQLRLGRQVYIVCPLVEESEKVDLQAATDIAEKLAAGEFRNYRVRLLHGRMKAGEKEEIMTAFRQGEVDVLVATTVIEVGVDVPNATMMVVLDADRFGLAQLHQLRGRVGRGGHQSYCILTGSPRTEEGKARLKAMTLIADGFALAEEDLRLRGPGEFQGTRQSGLPELKIADLLRDVQVFQTARQEAIALAGSDPNLTRPENSRLPAEIKARYSGSGGYMGIG